MKITPSRAIRIECGVCRRNLGPCTSKHCALNKAGKSLERIKSHCRDCAPDHRIEECTGQIIGTQAQAYHSLSKIHLIDSKAECPLYPFRFGKNPNLSRSLSEKQKKVLFECRQTHGFKKKEPFSESARARA
jgi:hypothetical protein